MEQFNLFIRGLKLKEQMSTDYNRYPFNLDVVKHIKQLEIKQPVTFLLGDNGSGKSTLLEAIAVSLGFNAEGGTKHVQFSTYESHSNLHEYITLLKGVRPIRQGFFFRAESFYNLKTAMQENEYSSTEYHNFSHGESVLELFKNYFNKGGLYLLDEPEAALSPTSQFALLYLIHEVSKNAESQFIIATHSPILASYFKGDIYEISATGINNINDFSSSTLYNLYMRFMQDKDFQKQMLNEE